ncbi:MAG: hypothetical protein LM582_07615 [Desulfurococcaceae archaeon]|nr:hypothetical protein [Desulfurococcaceae archaeon]
MSQGKLVKVLGYYIDASFIESVIATFRKLLIDIYWIYGRKLNDEGLYEIYLLVNKHPNLKLALLDLSKTVGIEEVKLFEEFGLRELRFCSNTCNTVADECKDSFVLHVPIYSRILTYKQGEVYGEDIPRPGCISRRNEG